MEKAKREQGSDQQSTVSGQALITGGAGFVGCNLASRLLSQGWRVRVFDNLSRRGTARNLAWLEANSQGNLEVQRGDVRDAAAVCEAVQDVDAVFHLAAQVAVTTSVTDPRTDFEVNALGTLNVLEAVCQVNPEVIVLFTSTNKVYGGMVDVVVVDVGSRYAFRDYPRSFECHVSMAHTNSVMRIKVGWLTL